MAERREAGELAEFFKFTTIGQAVVGRIKKFGNHPRNGPFVVFEPVLIRSNPKEEPVRYAGVAVGLSTDLQYKLLSPERARAEGKNGHDEGKFVSVLFERTEPSKFENNPKKVFDVLILSREEMIALSQGKENMGTMYKKPAESVSVSSMGHVDDDDLPF